MHFSTILLSLAFTLVTPALGVNISPALSQRDWCLTSKFGNSNGSPVVLTRCTNTDDQNWGLNNERITMYGGTMCLDVKDGVNADGSKLQLWQCANGNTNQQWFRRLLAGTLNVVAWSNNKCMDLTDGAVVAGTPIQIWTCYSGSVNQQWSIPGSFASTTTTRPAAKTAS